MDQNNVIECGGFYFIHNFDSGNLGHVENVPSNLIAPVVNTKSNQSELPQYEFNIWTRPDCAGTEFENGNRTWFYFGIQASEPNVLVRLNLVNLNKQTKMYNQGMAPVTRTLPGKPQWERIRDRPIHTSDENEFTLTFKYRTAENLKATTFFAFTYPFSYAELQIALNSVDMRMLPMRVAVSPDEIYYCRECVIYSLEGRRMDMLTISSHHGITSEREERLKNLFPEDQERPFKFENKKTIFVSARVHPGETPSSFVFNGLLNLLLTKNDPVAIHLRRLYVFKMIPFLNPDGVARGHYRTDTRGVNLNRVYLNPSLTLHPTVYAARALIRYYHYGFEKEDTFEEIRTPGSRSTQNMSESSEVTAKKTSSNTSNHKVRETGKRVKSAKAVANSKATLTVTHQSSSDSCDKSDPSNLSEQVCDMTIQEVPTQTILSVGQMNSHSTITDSLLNESVLRTCLGSNVHLSNSDELNIPGSNPLRPLRDTLKNSISLLLESTASGSDEKDISNEIETKNLTMAWCSECQRAINDLDIASPGFSKIVPGYCVTTTIQEALQKKREEIFFCTNCFKKYTITDNNEEIKLTDPISTSSFGVSTEGLLSETTKEAGVGSIGEICPIKDEKPKSPTKTVKKKFATRPGSPLRYKEPESGLFLYIDLHGHASKKGIFMYGNHFDDLESSVECMLLPRIMSLNSLHFHFSSCNFTERNMYLKDRRDGMSREGSGRVAVYKTTGLVRSYTLECNYNTGRLVNILPPPVRDYQNKLPTHTHVTNPPKYNPHIFEEVGKSLGASILDLTGQHPNSRIPCSEHRNLSAIREWLRAHSRTMRPQLTMSRLRPKTSSPSRVPLYVRSKTKITTEERKENTYAGAKSDVEHGRSPTNLPVPRNTADVINLNMKYAKRNDPPMTTRSRYLIDNEPKPKTLVTKRRNVLSLRKPNTSKGSTSSKSKTNRRSSENLEGVVSKLSKHSFSRPVRGVSSRNIASSSSEDMLPWDEQESRTKPSKRRTVPGPPALIKKIRRKNQM